MPLANASPIDDAAEYSVRVKSTVRYAFAGEGTGTSDGAGFLIDKTRGWILTNAHVSGYGTGDIEVSKVLLMAQQVKESIYSLHLN